APRPARSRRRALLIAAGVTAIAVGVTGLLARRPHAPAPGVAPSARGSGAALRAPEGPQIQPPADTRVRPARLAVDRAGPPGAGRRAAAAGAARAPGRAGVDRALAPPRPAAPGASDAGALAIGTTPGSGDGAPGDAGVHAVTVAPPTGADGRFVLTGLSPGRV